MFLKKYFSKSDPLAKVFRSPPNPYKIDLYYVRPILLENIKIRLRKIRED